ncbi:hypothetical protein BU16DRAFT_248616 [Lophium mytilinum]|uniref:Uncharacterized protein n=1 Tax=Lophium mytilinum TaxID=390894 RepID=A0A6A6R7Q7_9PEZI|nr:hypothetical protein BU16DRAFT_248616 [Lophium mytilinum]
MTRRLHMQFNLRGYEFESVWQRLLFPDPAYFALQEFSFKALHEMAELRELRVSFVYEGNLPSELLDFLNEKGPATLVMRDMVRTLVASTPKSVMGVRWGLSAEEALAAVLKPGYVRVEAAVLKALVREFDDIRASNIEYYADSVVAENESLGEGLAEVAN